MRKRLTDMCRVTIKVPEQFASRMRFLSTSIRNSFYGVISVHVYDEERIMEWFLEVIRGRPLVHVHLYLPRYSVRAMQALARSLVAVNAGDPIRIDDERLARSFGELFPGGN